MKDLNAVPQDKLWIYIDPDNRKRVPHGDHCERCKKPVKEIDKSIRVELSNDGMYARENKHGVHFIGLDCWKKLKKS